MRLRIGTRSSPLALTQTELFIKQLSTYAEFSFEVVSFKTTGDKIISKPLYDIGGKALFLKELENALDTGAIDIAVHSLKDVPGKIDSRFSLPFFMGREYPYDCFIAREFNSLDELPMNAKVGTCSPRRICLIKHIRPDIEIVPIRGNVETRISKLDAEEIDAIILAEAGLRRLGIFDPSFMHELDNNYFIPCAGQGVITAEVRSTDSHLIEILANATDTSILDMVRAERGFLEALDAGCDFPVAAHITKETEGCFLGRFMYSSNIYVVPKFISSIIDLRNKDFTKEIANQISR
ncbi:MAG: hydroxymethylbilane synthase [Rickettsiaceae bacterium]|nr:hydroxymethylbilane synthase [Rickettsiaceae bacterium]